MTDPPTLVHQLAELAARPPADLPGPVRRSVGQRVLDILGICVRATTLDTSAAATRYAVAQGGRPDATAIGTGPRLPAPGAAFVNGVLAHSLDYDDTHLPSILHPSASVVPAALAAAQASDADGTTTVAAAAAGIEIAVRLGMAGYDRDAAASVYFDRGQHATSICGAIGSAAAAAVVSKLDTDRIAHAMAIAASMASGIIEANRTGGTVKRLHCGWAAQAGVTAACLAGEGITGPPTVFEGRFGMLQAFLGDRADQAAVTDGLGEHWEVPSIFFKPYPANHFTHAGIDAALALAADGLRPDDVASATLAVAPATVRTIGEPLATKQTPDTGYQAQFSGPYTVTAALFGGGGLGLGLADFTDALAIDPQRRAVMARIDVVGSARCGEIYPHQFPAELSVTTNDGAQLHRSVLVNRGGPDHPLTDDELARKFDDNVDGLLDAGAATEVRDRALSLATEPDVHGLMTAVAGSGRVDD